MTSGGGPPRVLDPAAVRRNLDSIREEIGDGPTILAATKYLSAADLPALAEGGVTVCGENRAQSLEEKAAAHPGFTWDFIGRLQSRKVRQVLPLVRWTHSVATLSALKELRKHGSRETEVLVEVNVADEPEKEGVAPAELADFLARAADAAKVVGLMTMPPAAEDPEDSRRWFAALAQLAADHGLPELSMGTSQDYAVAAQEGATIVRIGSRLYT